MFTYLGGRRVASSVEMFWRQSAQCLGIYIIMLVYLVAFFSQDLDADTFSAPTGTERGVCEGRENRISLL